MITINGVNYPTLDEVIEALEDPNARQTKGVLELIDLEPKRCCLGVWANKAGLPSRRVHSAEIEYCFPDNYTKERWSATAPTDEYMSHYNLSGAGTPILHTEEDSKEWNQRGYACLIKMNDAGHSFKYIAAKLREWRDKGWIHDPR